MNDEQLAVLTDGQQDILDFAQRQQLRTHPATAITDLNRQVVRVFTGLADARLEVARLVAELSVVQRDLNGANAYIEDIRNQRGRLEAKVARLTEERREKDITIDALRDRGDEYRDERDRQREDIRRLVAWMEEQSTAPGAQDLLAGLKERYGG